MSPARFQILIRVFNSDKTTLKTTTRAKIFGDVDSANKAAIDWLREFRSGEEVVRFVRGKEEGMGVYGTCNFFERDDISAYAEVIKVQEEKTGDNGESAGAGEGKQ